MQDWRISKQKVKILFEMMFTNSIQLFSLVSAQISSSSVDETEYGLFVGSGGRTLPETPNERLRTQKRSSLRMGVL